MPLYTPGSTPTESSIGTLIAGATSKTTPVDADSVAISDSAAGGILKKLSWANLKTTAFAALGALIAAATGKTTPVDADTLLLSDSAAAGVNKSLTWANIKATLKSYFDTLYIALVAPGTSGNVLTSNGSAWTSAAPAGGGAWTLLSTVTAASSSTVDVETTFSSTYDAYCLVISGMTFSNQPDCDFTLKIGGSYASADYIGARSYVNSSGAVASASTGTASILFLVSGTNTAAFAADFVVWIYNPSSTSLEKSITWDGIYRSASEVRSLRGAAVNTGTAAMTGIRLTPSVGTVATGKFRLYGVSNS